jgi:hypothetical protein
MGTQLIYNGFTQNNNNRCYCFDAMEKNQPAIPYVVWVDLALFARYHVPLQSGPMFCLKLLQNALASDSGVSDRVRNYFAIDADFAELLSERAAKDAAIAGRKPVRRPFRKPSAASQLHRNIV